MNNSVIGWHASGTGGAVAAGGSSAVAVGIDLLEAGGNAADAAAATMFALAITDYGEFAIGGEISLIIYDATKQEVKVLCGMGTAPRDERAIEWYYANGIPDLGSYKAMPTPGAVHLCLTLLELYGSKSLEEVVAPALALLDAGEEWWYQRLDMTLRKMVEHEQQTSGSREEKLRAARDRFYRGDIADQLVAWYRSVGALLRRSDLEAHVTTVEEPVSITYRGYVVHKCNTWTQGPVLCQTLRLLEGYDLQKMGHLSTDYIHLVTEAMKLAYADRDKYYGDPEFVDVPMTQLLSDEYTEIRRQLIDMENASAERRPGDSLNMRALEEGSETGEGSVPKLVSDTTTCVVADRWGNVVAATPSCNLDGNEPDPRTGVTQGNRLRSLNTTPGHPNRIQPGKRPRITLTPTLVTKNGKPVVAMSVAGGDRQDQTTLNLLLNHIEFGLMPSEAATAPRFNTDHMENSFDSDPDRARTFMSPASLEVNSDISHSVQQQLHGRGHSLSVTSEPIASPVMIYLDWDTGIAYAAGDPAAGRHAAALDDLVGSQDGCWRAPAGGELA